MKLDKARYHVIAWFVYISYELILLRFYKPIDHIGYVLGLYGIEIALFYINFYLYKKITKDKSGRHLWWLQMLVSICLLAAFAILKWRVALSLGYISYSASTPDQMRSYFAGVIFRTALTIGESIGYWAIYRGWQKELMLHRLELDASKARSQKLELQQKLIKAQNAWLRSRINPHLLYNTLNFCYSRFSGDAQARKSVELLVSIMRFSMAKPGEDGLVPVTDEWTQIENYIALQELRFEKRLHISYIFINQNKDARIPPVILLTLVENIYKHGNLLDEASPAVIKLVSHKDYLKYSSRNLKRKASHPIAGEHIGMGNISTRLEQIYGSDGYELVINSEEPDFFQLELCINNNSKIFYQWNSPVS